MKSPTHNSRGQTNPYTHQALAHIRHLAEAIGDRGSCTPQERQASEYIAAQLRSLGCEKISIDNFRAIASTYQPFALAFMLALAGTLAGLEGGRVATMLTCILNFLGAWAMLAETELLPHWGRWLLPKANSQNVTSVIPPAGQVRARVVLSAHIDTHRTPVFYSSNIWYAAFSGLVGLAFLSMVAGTIIFGAGTLLAWRWISWSILPIALIQLFALALCLHAEFTPYSPGANDNASGVGVILGLAQRFQAQPMNHTEIHLVFTGCEEVGSYGMVTYVEQQAAALGDKTVYIVLDEVGLGTITYLSADGLVLKHNTHPRALELARQAAIASPELGIQEKVGVAYTDAVVATQRGLVALTVCTQPDPRSGKLSHWHQTSDTIDTLEMETLSKTHDFVWELLTIIDGQQNQEEKIANPR
ncbi:MAG: M28 family peptidase [Chloroflexota bacterium]